MLGDEDFRSTKYSIDKMIGSGAFSVVWYVLQSQRVSPRT